MTRYQASIFIFVISFGGILIFSATASAAIPPTSFNDPLFNGVTTSGAVTLSNGGSISDKSITVDGPQASIQCNGSCTINRVRISSAEGVRCTSGNMNIDRSWIEAQGVPGDHADGLQCYSPGSTGVNTITNTTFRAYNNDATAGYFSADNWRGEHRFDNVLFWGGPFGLRIPYDGGSAVYMKNVYFVGPFLYSPFLFDPISGNTIPIRQWENVRNATIVNGVLVPGSLIPCPVSNCGSTGSDTTPPTSPTNLSANATSQSSTTVSWTASTDNVAVSNYIIERCQGTGCSTFTQVGTPTASPFVDSGLTPNTFYNYHVRATDGAGNLSGWSNVVGATTQAPDTTPPTTPSNLQTSVASSSNITLTWTTSADNVGVTGYKVERCSGSGCSNFTQIGTPTSNSYSDTGLSATTTYRYRVRAVDGAGNNSSYSNISEGTTPITPPTPTFIAEYETTWNTSTSPKTTSNFSVQSGDLLVAYAVNEDTGNTITSPPTGTLQGTWILQQSITPGSYTGLRLWTLNVSSSQTNVNVTFTNSGGNFGGDVLHFRNTSSVGVTAQANGASGNPTLTLNGVSENSTLVMVNGDWSARTGSRTYNTTNAGTFTETSAYADGTSYGVEAGYYANAGTAGNKTIGLTAPTGMKWALAAIEVKGNPSTGTTPCNTVTPTNFSQAAYNSYGAPYDLFASNAQLVDAKCTSTDTHTITATIGKTGDTTRIAYTTGYYYDPGISDWAPFTGTCTGTLNGEWCAGPTTATITDPDISTASATNPAYIVGFTCSVQGGSWKCGCRDTACSNFYWMIQGAGQ